MMNMIAEEDKEKILPTVIAVDFDGTLVENKFPKIGSIRQEIWDAVVGAQEQGAKLILYTCRTGESETAAVEFCKEHGLIFDAVNDNVPQVKAVGWNARKVFANMYIDDRSTVFSRSSGFIPVSLEVE